MWISLSSVRQFVMGSAGMGSLLLGVPAVWADCPDCRNESLSPAGVYSAPLPSTMPSEAFSIESMPGGSWDASPTPYASPAPARVLKPALAVLPPPGTLGQTYHRQSWPIPKDEHPRTAIIEVVARGYTEMLVEGLADLEGFQRPDGVWVFKTEQPLTPGVPHIYHVKAGYKDSNPKEWSVRTVRLIPGRVVTLEY